ncbi:GNAT family N-acetyltransferase [Pasteurella sp. PK-2025]|uniref:GNAT family N-acetyltransferase n=1 Tax=unclassified Pasteurella TaxID=2621516 RepID=UPI003C78EEA2
MIIGEKISLKPIELSDSELLQKLMNDPSIVNNTVGWSFPVSLHSQESFIKSLSGSNRDYRFIIMDNQSKQNIGVTGLWNIHWQNRSAESAIKLLPEACNRGYGTETIMLIMAWAFYSVGLQRLYAEILNINQASLSLYTKKCHWRSEGVQLKAVFKAGEWHNLHNIAILKEEFDLIDNAKKYIDFVCPSNGLSDNS